MKEPTIVKKNPKVSNEVTNSLSVAITEVENSLWIEKDNIGEFNLYGSFLTRQGNLEYEGLPVIQWILSDNNELVIDCFTDIKINIYANINCTSLIINSESSIYLDAVLQVEDSILINALSLVIKNQTLCNDSLILNIQEGIALESTINCPNFIIKANLLYINNTINCENFIDIQGISPDNLVENLTIDNNANLNFNNGAIKTNTTNIAGNIKFNNIDLQTTNIEIQKIGVLDLTQSRLNGATLSAEGLLKFQDVSIEMEQSINFRDGCEIQAENLHIKSREFNDNSELKYSGQVAIFTENYVHTGNIFNLNEDVENELFYLEANVPHLRGAGHLNNISFKFRQLENAQDFITGHNQYQSYSIRNNLALQTEQAIKLINSINRACSLIIHAQSIHVACNYNQNKDLTLISTAGNTLISGSINTKNFGSTPF